MSVEDVFYLVELYGDLLTQKTQAERCLRFWHLNLLYRLCLTASNISKIIARGEFFTIAYPLVAVASDIEGRTSNLHGVVITQAIESIVKRVTVALVADNTRADPSIFSLSDPQLPLVGDVLLKIISKSIDKRTQLALWVAQRTFLLLAWRLLQVTGIAEVFRKPSIWCRESAASFAVYGEGLEESTDDEEAHCSE